MKREPVTSSTIKSIGHENGVMEIEFHGGKLYRYTGPKVTDHYNALMKAPSKGTHFAQNIRRCKDTACSKIEAEQPPPAK